MAKFEITAPNGERFELTAPDDASDELISQFIEEKLQSRPQERKDQLLDAGEQLVRGINRGVNALVGLPGEIVGGAVDLAGGDGDKFRWNNPVSRFMQSKDAAPQTGLGRFADAAGRAVGASALPTGALIANSARMANVAATTPMRGVVQQVGRNIAANPAAAVRADVAAATAGATGAQYAKELGYGPGVQSVAGFAGALAPSGVGAAASAGYRPVRRAMLNQGQSGAYGKLAESLDGDVEGLRQQIAAGTGPTAQGAGVNRDRVLRILGEEMNRRSRGRMQLDAGEVRAAQKATVQRVAEEANVSTETARDHLRSMARQYRESPLMFGEVPSIVQANMALRGAGGGLRQSRNVNVDDLNRIRESGPRQRFDLLASDETAPSGQIVKNALDKRQPELANTARRSLAEVGPQLPNPNGGPSRPATIVDASNLIEQAGKAASQAYGAAYRAPIDNRVMVHTLPRILQRYHQMSLGRAGERRDAMQRALSQFYVQTPNGPVAMMTLRQLQDARTTLRGQISGYIRDGRKDLVGAVQPIYRHITRLMSRMSPQWAQANRQWADMEFDRLGAELGDAFALKASPQFREQLQEFRDLAPMAQDIVRIHFLQKLYDRIENLGDTHSVSKLFTTDHARNAFRQIFGNDAAVQMTRVVRDIRAAEETFKQNSRTAVRQQARQRENADIDLVAAHQQMNAQGIRNALLGWFRQLLTEMRQRPMANIITTPARDTAGMAMHLERMRNQAARLRAFDRTSQPQTLPIGGLVGTATNQSER